MEVRGNWRKIRMYWHSIALCAEVKEKVKNEREGEEKKKWKLKSESVEQGEMMIKREIEWK